MAITSGGRLLQASFLAVLLALVHPLFAEQWITPTPEELSMTAQPQVPGAPAVYLDREDITEDDHNMHSVYVRLKVLTEGGKEFGNVEVQYRNGSYGGGYTVDSVEGRTIHSDGTIVPFTGKPYDKLVEKTKDVSFMTKVFSMPDVQVGSILEYRYVVRYDDHIFYAPQWYVQSKLFTRKAHFIWKPTDKTLITNDDRGQLTSMIYHFPILPVGTAVKTTILPPLGFHSGRIIYELNAHDIPPIPEEDHMPPIESLSYRVLFYYSPYRTADDYWKSEGKHWSKLNDKFIGPGSGVSAAARELVSPSDTEEQKLRKLYAAVMTVENTSFTREHSSAEQKSQGLREIRNTDDIWSRKRGSGDELAALFVAMARATGMKAYLAAVSDRDRNLFLRPYLNLNQLDDDIAIVTVNGKEQFFDPGSRFCPYGHLAWKHSGVDGLRQTGGGTDFVKTPGESYLYSGTQRVANLTLDEHGQVTGTISMTYMGSPALYWRQRSLEGDQASLERQLRSSLEELVPSGIEVKLSSVDHVADYEKPLVAHFNVTGTLGSSTGKRILLPGDIFEANARPEFPHAKREVPVAFEYSQFNQDGVRIHFPASFKIESLPTTDKISFKNFMLYATKTESTPTSFTWHRDFALGEIIYMVDEYPELRSFYSKVGDSDQQNVVLTIAADPAKAGN